MYSLFQKIIEGLKASKIHKINLKKNQQKNKTKQKTKPKGWICINDQDVHVKMKYDFVCAH